MSFRDLSTSLSGFFVPMIYQIGFKIFLYPKISSQLKSSNFQLKYIFVSIVLAVTISSVIIEYAYFAVEVLLIIPEHHKEARGSNYEVVPWLKALNWGFIIVFLSGERYRKHLVNTGDVIEIKNENLSDGNQISLLTLGFVLSLSSFILLLAFVDVPYSEYCQKFYV